MIRRFNTTSCSSFNTQRCLISPLSTWVCGGMTQLLGYRRGGILTVSTVNGCCQHHHAQRINAFVPSALPHTIIDISDNVFDVITSADDLVAAQLTGLSPLSIFIVLGAGLVTSLSPCTLSVLPLTIGYIGGFSSSPDGEVSSPPVVRASAFAAGLATTFAALGLLSSFLGGAYGQIGDILPIIVSVVAIIMGLNLLEVVTLQLPSLNSIDTRTVPVGPTMQAYLAGLTFALAASPCSTPVLATLLAYVSTTRDPVTGAALLFAYALGYVAPLLAAALFTGTLQNILEVRKWSGWVTPASGVLLLAGGTYGLLSRTIPY